MFHHSQLHVQTDKSKGLISEMDVVSCTRINTQILSRGQSTPNKDSTTKHLYFTKRNISLRNIFSVSNLADFWTNTSAVASAGIVDVFI